MTLRALYVMVRRTLISLDLERIPPESCECKWNDIIGDDRGFEGIGNALERIGVPPFV